jgi:hypothetical protein
VGSAAEASCGLQLPAIAAAAKVFPVGRSEDPCATGELVQVEVAAVVQFEEGGPVSRPHHIGQVREWKNAGLTVSNRQRLLRSEVLPGFQCSVAVDGRAVVSQQGQ